MKARALLFFLPLLLPALPLQAATAEELARIQENLQARKQQDAALKKQLDKTEDELSRLRENLVRAMRENQKSEDMLDETQDRLATLERDERTQKAQLAEQREKLGGILGALLRLARTPPEALLLSPEKPVDTLRSGLLLQRVLPFYAEAAQKLSSQLKALQETRAAILEKQKDLIETREKFGQQQEDLNRLLAERQTWLHATESQRADVQKQIGTLSAEAQNVQELMQKVTGASLKLPGKVKKQARVTFTPPTKGWLAYGFGDADDVGATSRGLMFKARSGDMVVAPADGQVVFAGPFKGYGTILILRHGDDYHSFLAGFGRLDVAVGQMVNAGEPLGRTTAEKESSAQLYFELRRHGSPIDPAAFIRTASVANKDRNSPASP